MLKAQKDYEDSLRDHGEDIANKLNEKTTSKAFKKREEGSNRQI
jgi:hypothetical protein